MTTLGYAAMGPERLHLQRCIEQPLTTSKPGDSSIALEAEIPEVLLDGMREFLDSHPQWDQMQVISSALASFLYQNGCNDNLVSQHYLDGLFRRA